MALVRKAVPKKPSTGKKVVPKKPSTPKAKAEPKAKAIKLAAETKATAEKSVALERVSPMVITATSPEAPASMLSKSFIKEAQRLDAKIVATIDRMGKDIVYLGQAFGEMQDKGYHTALGFQRFELYLTARWPDQAKTQVFQAMRIVRELTGGPSPAVADDDIRQMTATNAEGLARMKKAGQTITPELISQAKTMPIQRFQTEIVLPSIPELATRQAVRDGNPLAVSTPEILVKRTFTLSAITAANLGKCFEICRWINKDDAEDKSHKDEDSSFEEKAMAAIVGEFLSTYQAEYEQALADAESHEAANAQANSNAMGELNVTPEDEDEEADDALPETSTQAEEAAEAAEADVVEGESAPEEERTLAERLADADEIDGEGEDEKPEETGDLADENRDQDGKVW